MLEVTTLIERSAYLPAAQRFFADRFPEDTRSVLANAIVGFLHRCHGLTFGRIQRVSRC